MPKTRPTKNAFTIIEVVLVLAIAGLIFAMVFVALPGLQNAQKEKQRQQDLARFLTAASNYASHNKGRHPWQDNTGWNDLNVPNFVKRYIDEDAEFTVYDKNNVETTKCSSAFADPDGSCYKFREGIDFSTGYNANKYELKTTGWTKGDHLIRVATGAKCGDNEEDIIPTRRPSDIMMFYQNPSSSSMWHQHQEATGTVICVDNQ